MGSWERKLERYDRLVAECDGFERKGKGMPYTSDNGHMFSLLNKAGELGIRFSKEVQEAYLASLKTTPLESHGATMRGYVKIPEKLFKTPAKVIAMLEESHEYVMGLDPK